MPEIKRGFGLPPGVPKPLTNEQLKEQSRIANERLKNLTKEEIERIAKESDK